jgi:hypothetical protein
VAGELLRSEKGSDVNSGFAENRSQGAFRYIARVMRDRHFSSRLSVAPDFVAAGAGAIESKAKYAKPPHDLSIGESGEPTHRFTSMQ